MPRHCRAGLRRLARHRDALPFTEVRALASAHGVELGRIGLRVVARSRRLETRLRLTGWSRTADGADAVRPVGVAQLRAGLGEQALVSYLSVASTVGVPGAATVALMGSLHAALLRGATLAQALHTARAGLDRSDRAQAQALAWHGFGAFGPA